MKHNLRTAPELKFAQNQNKVTMNLPLSKKCVICSQSQQRILKMRFLTNSLKPKMLSLTWLKMRKSSMKTQNISQFCLRKTETKVVNRK